MALESRVRRIQRSRIWTALSDLVSHDASGLAAELAYRVFVALIPALLFAGSVFGLVAPGWFGPDAPAVIRRQISQDLPPDAARVILPYVMALLVNRSNSLASASLLLTFWTMASAIMTVMKSATRILNVRDARSYVARRVQALALATYLPVFLISSLGLTWFRAQLRHAFLHSPSAAGLVFPALRTGTAAGLVLLAIALLLHAAAPQPVSRRTLAAGTLATVCGFWLASELFALFARHFVHYRNTYGLLGGALGLVTWLYLCAMALLVGIEIMGLLQRREIGMGAEASQTHSLV